MERVYFAINDNMIEIEGCRIPLPELFLEKWSEWVNINFGETFAKISRSPELAKSLGLPSGFRVEKVLEHPPLHFNAVASLALHTPENTVLDGTFYQPVPGESMTDFFGQKILSDDGNQDLTVPEYMKAFIDSLTEAKHAPVTLAEYMQAVVNKMTAYPELWKKGIND